MSWIRNRNESADDLAVPGGGQNKILENYWTSIELSAETYVPEWGMKQVVSIFFKA